MDEIERRLASALRSVAAAPPNSIDPTKITAASPRHPRTFIASIGVACVVAAIAISVFAMVHQGAQKPMKAASAPTGATTGSQQPNELVGAWVLNQLLGFEGATPVKPDMALTFRFEADGTVRQGCATAIARLGPRSIQFIQDWVRPAPASPNGCPDLGVQQSRFLFGEVLVGTATWEIHDGSLTVRHDSAGAVFHRAPQAGDATADAN